MKTEKWQLDGEDVEMRIVDDSEIENNEIVDDSFLENTVEITSDFGEEDYNNEY